jgi:hypothetical protein
VTKIHLNRHEARRRVKKASRLYRKAIRVWYYQDSPFSAYSAAGNQRRAKEYKREADQLIAEFNEYWDV